jgi:hypothetical protein
MQSELSDANAMLMPCDNFSPISHVMLTDRETEIKRQTDRKTERLRQRLCDRETERQSDNFNPISHVMLTEKET